MTEAFIAENTKKSIQLLCYKTLYSLVHMEQHEMAGIVCKGLVESIYPEVERNLARCTQENTMIRHSCGRFLFCLFVP